MGLGILEDIFSGIQNNNALSRALSQQLSGINNARVDINAAQKGSEGILFQGTTSALDQGNAGLEGILGPQGTGPYTQTGANAAYALNGYQSPTVNLGSTSFNFDPSKVQFDPGTQQIMDEAAKTLSRSAAGRGSLNSGGTTKDISNYLTSLSSQLYGQAYNREFQNAQEQYNTQNQQNLQQYTAGQENAGNQFNRLYSLSGQGLSATGQDVNALTQFYEQFMGLDANTAARIAQSRTATGTNLADLNLAEGNARASQTMNKVNNLTGSVNAGMNDTLEGISALTKLFSLGTV